MKIIKGFIILILGIISALYIANPTAGIFELIPDNMPFIGNLDEAGATLLFLSCLKYFGIDLVSIFSREKSKETISKM